MNHKNLFYPPGGLLLWMVAFLEILTFGVALVVMVVLSKEDPTLFHTSRLSLNSTLGTVNTIILLVSGLFMVTAVSHFKEGNRKQSYFYLQLTLAVGVLFVLVKSWEYYQKIQAGISIGTNTFFSFYWMLTLFHLAHVLFGLVILTSFRFKMKNESASLAFEDFEAGATFWHLCDLLWLLLFPMLYLFF